MKLRYIALTALLAGGCLADTANTFTYNGTPASTTYNEDVSASFIVSGGNLLVTLTNTTPSLTYDKQILTGVLFTYAGAGSVAGTVSNPTATSYDINDSNGALTSAGSTAANWSSLTGTMAGYVTLTNLNGNGGGSNGIISSTTNPSGTNNLAKHEVYFEGPRQFTISGLDLTSASQITGVEFNFGTTLGTLSPQVTRNLTTGAVTATPEPSAFLLLGCGLLGISWIGRKRFPKP